MSSLQQILEITASYNATLVAVSKTKSIEEIQKVYDLGIRDFGENRVQELVAKNPALPGDIRWHMIGHLQRNKVRFITPFIHCIQSVDSEKLIHEINKQGQYAGRRINVLLQVRIAREESKYGLDYSQLGEILKKYTEGIFPCVQVQGLMGMATFTGNADQIRQEFGDLRKLFDEMNNKFRSVQLNLTELSMGMSGDFNIALEAGSTMVRIGSLIFGARK